MTDLLIPPRSAIDLTRVWKTFLHGDLAVHLTWFLDVPEGTPPKPCLVIVPAYEQRRERGAVPCVVLLDQAWRWDERIGAPRDVARMALRFAGMLGLGASPSQAIRVRGIIVDHLGDLLAMPPMPTEMRHRVVIGEAVVRSREGGEVVRQHEFAERV